MSMERRKPASDAQWLFADVGGTNVRVCRWQGDAGAGPIARSPADAFDTLDAALRALAGAHALLPDHCALAVAAPVHDAPMPMTNRGWVLDAAVLRRALGLQALRVVNDFVAAAAGIAALDAAATQTVRAGVPRPASRLLLGPGTGLGVAAVLDAGGSAERIVASEGGHMGFGYPEDALAPLLAAMHARWGRRLSWERLLSGDGLARLHAWQAGLAAPLEARQVSACAAAGDPAARRAVQWFCRLLGACAGDLCLAFGADGGVWLTGGVLDGLGQAFDAGAFLEAFDDKGRYRARQREVPVHRVLATDLAFRGLARITRTACRAPGLLVTPAGIEALH